jgi:hypothetical protein
VAAADRELIGVGLALLGVAPGELVGAAWLRARRNTLALAFHPDHHPSGGDPEALRAVLAAAELLERDGRAPDLYRIEVTAGGVAVVVDE